MKDWCLIGPPHHSFSSPSTAQTILLPAYFTFLNQASLQTQTKNQSFKHPPSIMRFVIAHRFVNSKTPRAKKGWKEVLMRALKALSSIGNNFVKRSSLQEGPEDTFKGRLASKVSQSHPGMSLRTFATYPRAATTAGLRRLDDIPGLSAFLSSE